MHRASTVARFRVPVQRFDAVVNSNSGAGMHPKYAAEAGQQKVC